MNERTYTCTICGGIFVTTISEDEQIAEMLELWGELPEEERVEICDDCFKLGIDILH